MIKSLTVCAFTLWLVPLGPRHNLLAQSVPTTPLSSISAAAKSVTNARVNLVDSLILGRSNLSRSAGDTTGKTLALTATFIQSLDRALDTLKAAYTKLNSDFSSISRTDQSATDDFNLAKELSELMSGSVPNYFSSCVTFPKPDTALMSFIVRRGLRSYCLNLITALDVEGFRRDISELALAANVDQALSRQAAKIERFREQDSLARDTLKKWTDSAMKMLTSIRSRTFDIGATGGTGATGATGATGNPGGQCDLSCQQSIARELSALLGRLQECDAHSGDSPCPTSSVPDCTGTECGKNTDASLGHRFYPSAVISPNESSAGLGLGYRFRMRWLGEAHADAEVRTGRISGLSRVTLGLGRRIQNSGTFWHLSYGAEVGPSGSNRCNAGLQPCNFALGLLADLVKQSSVGVDVSPAGWMSLRFGVGLWNDR